MEWLHGINLGGADAIHVATAITLGCKEFLTFDRKKRKSPLASKSELAKLGLRAIVPSDTLYLPASYKQQEIKYPQGTEHATPEEKNALVEYLESKDDDDVGIRKLDL